MIFHNLCVKLVEVDLAEVDLAEVIMWVRRVITDSSRHFLVTGDFTGTWRDGFPGVTMDGFYRSLMKL